MQGARFGELGKIAEYRAVTATNLDPYSRGADLEMPGFNHELLALMAERSGVPVKIEYLPWRRAQDMAQSEPGTLIFGITRNEKREPLYQWVSHLLTNETVFISNDAPINSLEEAAALDDVGAFAVRYARLEALGWTNVQEANPLSNYKKLAAGRLDAVWTLASRAAFYWNQEQGLDVSQLVIGEPTSNAELWLAAHPDFPSEDAARLVAAYDEIVADGTYEALHQQYFGELNIVWDRMEFNTAAN